MTRSKLEKIEKVIKETIEDCEGLEKKKELTEKGKGQLILAKLLNEILNE